MNRRPLSVDLGLLEPLDSLSEPMANTARKITAESLHARLPVENPHDEFGRLAGRPGVKPQNPAAPAKGIARGAWHLRSKQRPHGAKTSSRSGSRARVRAADPMHNVEDLPTDER